VRFRTAIKDPEELIFLFLAIAVGLGLGADQRIPTIAAVAVIMLYLFGRTLFDRNRNKTNTVYLNIQIENNPTESNLFDQVNSLLLDELREIDLRRLDQHKDQVQMTYYVNVTDQKKLVSLMDRLKQRYPDSIVSVVEQNNLLGG
jgi:uncharacterized membrane protein YhiD involved in acid resistance